MCWDKWTQQPILSRPSLRVQKHLGNFSKPAIRQELVKTAASRQNRPLKPDSRCLGHFRKTQLEKLWFVEISEPVFEIISSKQFGILASKNSKCAGRILCGLPQQCLICVELPPQNRETTPTTNQLQRLLAQYGFAQEKFELDNVPFSRVLACIRGGQH